MLQEICNENLSYTLGETQKCGRVNPLNENPLPLGNCTNRTDRHYIAEILLKVALNTITLAPNPLLIIRHPYIYE